MRYVHVEDFSLPETCYWYGFLLADGSFSKRQPGRVRLSLATKDAAHVERFRSWVGAPQPTTTNAPAGYNGSTGSVSFTVMSTSFRTWQERGLIRSRKTYNPPKARTVLDTVGNPTAVLAGIIDGDGSVSNKYITIRSHVLWTSFFEGFLPEPWLIMPQGDYLTASLGPRPARRALHSEVAALGLPTLSRKWDKLAKAVSQPSKYEVAAQFRADLAACLEEGLTLQQAADRLGVDYSRAYQSVKSTNWGHPSWKPPSQGGRA